jgi:redox-sensitive bicupin YhaK (pirin superfamily)
MNWPGKTTSFRYPPRNHDQLQLIVAPGAPDGSLEIHQDARLFSTILGAGEKVEHQLSAGRGAWIQAARGNVDVNGVALDFGDGAAIEDETSLTISARGAPAGNLSEVLLLDLGR